MPLDMKRYSSLTYNISVYSIVVIAIAMMAYSVLQFLADPLLDPMKLLAEDLAQVFVLGGIIHLGLNFVLKRKLLRPLEKLYVKMYAIGQGDYQPITLDSDIREFQEIAGAINSMQDKLAKHPVEVTLNDLAADAKQLHRLADDPENGCPDDVRDALSGLAARLDAKIHASRG